jgi:hypothetical protein
MRLARPLGWLTIGAIIGALAAEASTTARAQSKNTTHMVRTSLGHMGSAELVTLWDERSAGCWLAVEGNTISSLAVANPKLCEK